MQSVVGQIRKEAHKARLARRRRADEDDHPTHRNSSHDRLDSIGLGRQ